ncbi:MAG: hypothetical protein AAGC63_10930 [Propionicimonas sp.]|nr:hypothetical protein [Propionicimonas sp.]
MSRGGPPTGLRAVGSLAVGTLAVWRVSRLVVHEDGPAGLVVRVRALVDRTPLAGVMDCFACTSVWVAPVVAVALFGGRLPARDVVVTAAALSGAAMLVERAVAGGGDGYLPEPETDSPLVSVVEPGRRPGAAAPDDDDPGDPGPRHRRTEQTRS